MKKLKNVDINNNLNVFTEQQREIMRNLCQVTKKGFSIHVSLGKILIR